MEAFAETLVARLVQLLRTPSPIGDTDAALGLISGWLCEMRYTPARTRKGAVVVTLPGRADNAPRAITAHLDTWKSARTRRSPVLRRRRWISRWET
jgi:putative aminopeptidase FrvX